MPNVLDIHAWAEFNRSESMFRYWANRRTIYTQGIKYFAQEANCYWLIDEIFLVLLPELINKNPDNFYSVKFVAHADHTATVVVGDGNGNNHLEHKINWTDFPVKEEMFKFFLCESGDGYCLMLPSEY